MANTYEKLAQQQAAIAAQKAADAEQNRQAANARGNEINDYLKNREQYYYDNEDAYRGNADRAYGDLASVPGYTWEEATGIVGNPGAGFGYYDPRKLTGLADESATGLSRSAGDITESLRGAAGRYGEGVRSAADKYGTGITDAAKAAGASVTGASGANAPAIREALNNELNWQGGVYGYQRGENEAALGDLESGLASSNDRDKLALNQDFAGEYRMSPAAQQRFRDVAGQTVRAQFQNLQDDAEMRAMAGGNVSPAALAAIKERLARQGASGAADAMTRAELTASQEAAGRLKDIEGMRLGTEQDISTRGANAAATRYGAKQGAARDLTAMEMQGIDRNTANRIAAESALGSQAYDAAKTAAGYGVTGARDAADLGYRAADTAGQAGMNAETGASGYQFGAASQGGAQRLNTEQYNQQAGQGLATAADAAASARNTGIANQRIAGQDKVRNYLTTEQGMAQQGRENATGQQIQTYGAQTGAANAATNAGTSAVNAGTAATQVGSQASQAPGTFGKILGAATGVLGALGGGAGIAGLKKMAKGGAADSPTEAMVGERGPEYVGPPEGAATAIQQYQHSKGGGNMQGRRRYGTVSRMGDDQPAQTYGGNPSYRRAFKPVSMRGDGYDVPGNQPGGANGMYGGYGQAPDQMPTQQMKSAVRYQAMDESTPDMATGMTTMMAQDQRQQQPQYEQPPSAPAAQPQQYGGYMNQMQRKDGTESYASPMQPTVAPSSTGSGSAGATQPQPQQQTATAQQPQSQSFSSPFGKMNFGNSGNTANPMRRGGIVTKPTRAIIGEDGPEVVIPLSGDADAKITPGQIAGIGAATPRVRNVTGTHSLHNPLRPMSLRRYNSKVA